MEDQLDRRIRDRREVDRRVSLAEQIDQAKATVDAHRLCGSERAGRHGPPGATGVDALEESRQHVVQRVIAAD
jgi:hypothetical protein